MCGCVNVNALNKQSPIKGDNAKFGKITITAQQIDPINQRQNKNAIQS